MVNGRDQDDCLAATRRGAVEDRGLLTADRVQGSGIRVQDSSPSPVASSNLPLFDTVVLPSFERVSTDKAAFADMTRAIYHETNPYSGRRLVQVHGREAVVVNPPALPLTEGDMDRIYGLPFTRAAASELRQAADSSLRGGKKFHPDSARLFWRMRVLFHHRSRRQSDPKPQRKIDPGRNPPPGRGSAISRG